MPAVSVIPLRDGPHGLEVFVQHRVDTMDFAAGVVVFPGGRVDPCDHVADPRLPEALAKDLERSLAATFFVGRAADPLRAVLTLVACGLREVREETGVTLDPATVRGWANWVTPPELPRRFDVIFLVATPAATEAEAMANTTTEAHDARWWPVRSLVEAAGDGAIQLMAPQQAILAGLASRADSAAAAIAGQAAHVITPVHHDLPGE